MKTIGIVIKPYQSTSTDPIVMKTGDILQVTDRTTDMVGWVWCVHADGMSSWVPEKFIERDGASAIALRSYHATELTVEIGEEFNILEEVAGWYLCADNQESEGWIPASHMEIIQNHSKE